MLSGSALKRSTVTIRVGLFWVAFALALIGLGQTPRLLGPGWHELALGSVLALVTLGLIALFLRREKHSFADIGLAADAGTVKRLLGGTALGIVIALAMLAIIVGLTSLRIEPVASPDYGGALGRSFAVLFVLAYMEEIAFRTFPLVRLQDAWGVRVAILVTAVAFALYHGPTNPMNLLGPGVWGLLYGLAAVASRGIALPLGIHFGANWTQSLFEMKTRYASGIWHLTPGSTARYATVEQVGIALQVVLLVAGVVLIERYVRRHDGSIVA